MDRAARIEILLIEDLIPDQELFEIAVRNIFPRLRITIADRLALGIAAARNRHFDIVFVDLGLPDSAGIATVTTALNNFKLMPVIFLTGLKDEAMSVRAIETGALDYCSKGDLTSAMLDKTISFALARYGHTAAEQKKISELKEKNDNLLEFIGIVSHDLRAPVSSIITACRDHRPNYLVAEATRQLINQISQSGVRAHNLISDLFSLAALESGKLAIEKSDFCLECAAKEIILEMASVAARKNVTVSLAGVCLYVHADRNKILQVFSNLLQNAIRFSPYSGTVLIQANHRAQEALISVVDSGPGVDPEIIPDLFKKQVKTVRPSLNGESGTGFGLPLVAEILRAHGSKIRLQNLVKNGARFSFILPSQQQSGIVNPSWKLQMP